MTVFEDNASRWERNPDGSYSRLPKQKQSPTSLGAVNEAIAAIDPLPGKQPFGAMWHSSDKSFSSGGLINPWGSGRAPTDGLTYVLVPDFGISGSNGGMFEVHRSGTYRFTARLQWKNNPGEQWRTVMQPRLMNADGTSQGNLMELRNLVDMTNAGSGGYRQEGHMETGYVHLTEGQFFSVIMYSGKGGTVLAGRDDTAGCNYCYLEWVSDDNLT